MINHNNFETPEKAFRFGNIILGRKIQLELIIDQKKLADKYDMEEK